VSTGISLSSSCLNGLFYGVLRFLARNGLRLGGFVRETESCEEMHSL